MLDEHGTFHGMGMTAAETSSGQSILRAKVTSLDVAIVGRVQIHFHKEESCAMSAVTYQKLILNKFCCQIGNVSSMRLSCIMLKQLNFLVGTAKPMMIKGDRDAK